MSADVEGVELGDLGLDEGAPPVVELGRELAAGRTQRLVRLGFDPDHAARLSELHTRNFM